jgi:hypothetical protein
MQPSESVSVSSQASRPAPGPNSDSSALAVVAILLATAALIATGLMSRRSDRRESESENRRRSLQGELAQLAHERERSEQARNSEFHTLAMQKLRKEIELLEAQVQISRRELASRSDSDDYHDLMMEKARLDIEGMKLHIKEQRKRLDDFGSYDE